MEDFKFRVSLLRPYPASET